MIIPVSLETMKTKNYHCAGVSATFKVTQRLLRPSLLPQPQIKFNFLFNTEHSNYLQHSPSPLFIERRTHESDSSSATVDVVATPSFEDVEAAIRRAVGNNYRDELIARAWAEVVEKFPAGKVMPEHTILYLSFFVEIEHRHVFVEEEMNGDDEVEGERRCCICLEEIGGGGGEVGMVCEHVFHGGCIEEWLRRSRYCPLCRCELPEMEME